MQSITSTSLIIGNVLMFHLLLRQIKEKSTKRHLCTIWCVVKESMHYASTEIIVYKGKLTVRSSSNKKCQIRNR